MLKIRTVLHATDFSGPSQNAFHVACSLARDHGAGLVVLHVAPAPILAYGGVMAPPPPPEPDRKELLAKLRQLRALDPKVPVEHVLAEGDAADEILRVARECRCDLIVLGTHGRTGLGRLLMGSVAEKVVRKAACAVLTVKTPLPDA
jgi:nucleotide-binding universal stress UspA family protein